MAVILIKIATGILAVVAAKPETFLKLFSAKLGIDFSTFKRERSYGARIAFLDEFSE